MPTFNRIELLKKAIESVQNQTYSNFKLVIVNDGSSDGTEEYLQSLTDPRITHITNASSQGACRSRNFAIRHLDTELVTGLDDDDVFLPERLEQLLNVYNERYAFVCSGYFWDYGAHKKALFKDDREISLSDAFDLNQCSNQILVNRERLLSVGCFDESIPALQDHDLWVRLIAQYGDAYRIGIPSYIVNDDHSLERISSVKNKLNAITMFEEKHSKLMSKRNKENFVFYRQKINNDRFSFVNYIQSLKYGLAGLKTRQYLSQYFKTASQLRLQYLQTGSIAEQGLLYWLSNILLPLMATGGPGASRVILLSACIYFLGATETSSFSGDFFIIMLLNTAFSQSYGFFLLKQKFENSLYSVVKQSVSGVLLSFVCIGALFYLGIISSLKYSLILTFILHFYYVFRFKNIAIQNFKPMAVAEIVISVFCLILPILASKYFKDVNDVPYIIYTVASFIGLVIVIFMTDKRNANQPVKIPFSTLRNISISTTASIFAIFILPAAIKSIAEPHIVSIVALTISCMSISMLIPRTYANKIMKKLGESSLSKVEFKQLSESYSRLIVVSSTLGGLITISYLSLINSELDIFLLIVPIAITAILVAAQHGFISLTFLSLQGADQQVAKMNSMVLAVSASVTLPVMSGWVTEQMFVYVIIVVACLSFVVRNKRASITVKKFIK